MQVCRYAYIHLGIYVFMHVCMFVCMHICLYTYMHICICSLPVAKILCICFSGILWLSLLYDFLNRLITLYLPVLLRIRSAKRLNLFLWHINSIAYFFEQLGGNHKTNNYILFEFSRTEIQ